MDVHVDSETAPLQSVVVGYPDNFLDVEPEIINETQRKFYDGPDVVDDDRSGPNEAVEPTSLRYRCIEPFERQRIAHGIRVDTNLGGSFNELLPKRHRRFRLRQDLVRHGRLRGRGLDTAIEPLRQDETGLPHSHRMRNPQPRRRHQQRRPEPSDIVSG